MDKHGAFIKKETMKSRERVLAAINHQQVDRIPIDLGFHYSTGISAFAYWNLREYLGMNTDQIEVPDMMQFLAKVDDDILKRFHCDCMLLNPGWQRTRQWNPRGRYNFRIPASANLEKLEDGSWSYGWGMARMPDGGFFFDGKLPAFEEESENDMISRYTKESERIFKETDYFTMFIGYHAYYVSDNIDWQCRMLTDPDEVISENQQVHNKQIQSVAKVIDNMGEYIQAIAINSDLGSQNGPLCRPSIYEDLCAPFVKEFCDFVHQNSDLKIYMHSCGSIKPFIQTLIDCGVDILNPVQISAKDMDASDLKEQFGNYITFWGGGCNTQEVLNFGSPDDVKKNVRELVKIYKPGSGYVFNQVHNIMGDVKPENIVAMLDTAYEESWIERVVK